MEEVKESVPQKKNLIAKNSFRLNFFSSSLELNETVLSKFFFLLNAKRFDLEKSECKRTHIKLISMQILFSKRSHLKERRNEMKHDILFCFY